MANFVTVLKGAWAKLSSRAFKVNSTKADKSKSVITKQLHIFTLAVKGFNEDNCLMRATALTFYSLFSVVPILALVFAISKGFGFDKTLQTQIKVNYAEYATVLENAFVYADSMLSNAKGGLIAGMGIVLLLFSVMKLLINIENSFNQIWEIKKGRSLLRKVADYLTIMMVGPIFLIVAGGLTVSVQAHVGKIDMFPWFTKIMLELLAFLIVAGVFTFLYMVMPNTKVQFKSAFTAGVVAMILFELLQWGYVKFQIKASAMNAIYGGFAALPLFLIWVQYSWYIILFGAEIAFANQYYENYELEGEINKLSPRYKRSIALLIANKVAKRFYNGEKALSGRELAHELNLPLRLVNSIMNEFTQTGIFIEVRGDARQEIVYQPGITESKLTVNNLLISLNENGLSSLPVKESPELKDINDLLDKMDNAVHKELANLPVKDIA